jgi:hypothetical protein
MLQGSWPVGQECVEVGAAPRAALVVVIHYQVAGGSPGWQLAGDCVG